MSEEQRREEDRVSPAGEMSRREFIKDAGLIAGSAAIGSIASLATLPAETVSAQAAPVSYQVFDPQGAFEVTQLFAPRLTSMEGKTIGMIMGSPVWEADRTFPLIASLLKKMYPTVKIIQYTDLPRTNTNDPDSVAKAVKAAGCDAVIVGNAG